MKKLLYILGVVAMLALPMAARTVNYPPVRLNTTENRGCRVTVCGVDLLPDSTVVRMSVKFKPEKWIRISKNTYIQAGMETYPVLSAEGIKIGELHWIPTSGTAEFSLIFPAIPVNTKSIDLVESKDWQFLGIDVRDAKDRQQYFADFSKNASMYDYTYLSPLMLRTLSPKTVQDIPVDKVTKMEMVKCKYSYNDSKLKHAVQELIGRNGLELVSREVRNEKASEFYGVWDEAKKEFTKLLIVQGGDYKQHDAVLYLEGGFTLADIQTLIKSPTL